MYLILFCRIFIIFVILYGVIEILFDNQKEVGYVSFILAALIYLVSLIPQQKDAAKPDESNPEKRPKTNKLWSRMLIIVLLFVISWTLTTVFSLIQRKDATKPIESNQKSVVSEEKDNNTENEESKDEKVVIKEEKIDVKKEEPEESVQEFIEAEVNKILQDKEIESNNTVDSANVIEVTNYKQSRDF